VSDLTAVGNKDNWICWLCDKPVDQDASVNSDLGPSVDSFAATRVKKGSVAVERIAHRQCNTMKGKVSPVVPWSKDIFVVDPAPIFETVERLRKKGGRDIIARCPGEQEANEAATWLLDRLSRLTPELSFETQVSSGGGQYVLALKIS
jgi:hypothetical protein